MVLTMFAFALVILAVITLAALVFRDPRTCRYCRQHVPARKFVSHFDDCPNLPAVRHGH